MIRIYAISVLFCLNLVVVSAQSVESIIANLKNELQANPVVTKRASIYSDLTWYYSTVSIDSALFYGSKAIQESKKSGDSTLIAQVYSDIGAVYFRKGDFGNSKDNYLNAYKIRKVRRDYKGLAKINNNLANIYEKEGEYKLAMSKFLESLQYFESIQDEKNSNTIKGNIGLILLKIKSYPKALKYISEVIEYQEENNLAEGLCVSCLNLGNVYLQMNDTVNALEQYQKSLKNCTLVGDKKGMASGYNNIGSIKSEQKKSKDALALYSKSKQFRDQLHSDLDKANYDLNVAKELIVAKRYEQAKNILLAVEKIFYKEDLKEKLQISYKSLILVYGKLNQPDSVSQYVNKMVRLNSQLLENTVLKQTAELETKYQTEKKEKLLIQNKAETRQKNILLFGISVLALLIGLIGYLIYRQQKLRNRQQEQEFKLKSAISEIETQNKLQEQRLTISRDLHDNIGSQLTYIISSITNLKYRLKDDEKLSGQLDKIGQFAGETISELRDTIWAVNSNTIKFDDLRVRIYNAIEKAKHAKPDIHIDFSIDEQLAELQLTAFVGLNIFRTIQEIVNNALKYADATAITIEIFNRENCIEIKAGDNGKGFDVEAVSRGNGLNNMAKRMEDIGGDFSLESKPSAGTLITISIDKEKLS
ncbi:MAG: tetratricopeptide repeat protein [Paludibacter sp.]|nr:tetratricopeptide repeat protein [Paludibacter sp.]